MITEYLSSQMFNNIVQLLELLAVVAGFYLGLRELRSASDSRNIDFIIEAEGQIDPLFLEIAQSPPKTIRAVLPNLVPADVPDAELQPYVLTYFAYRHTSRILYMIAKREVSIGMTKKDRDELLVEWVSELRKYNIDHIRKIHKFSHVSGEFNPLFMSFMDEHLRKFASEANTGAPTQS